MVLGLMAMIGYCCVTVLGKLFIIVARVKSAYRFSGPVAKYQLRLRRQR